MKKYLLGTTAFAAASLVASGASAQSLEDRIRTLEEQMLMGAPGSGFDITVSGYIHGGFFLQDIDPKSNPNGGFGFNTGPEEDYGAVDVKMGGAEAQFTAQTTLDNGIDLMGRIELSGFTTSDQIDETYIRAQGGFGQVTLGADDDAWNLTHYSSPNPGLNGIDSPNYRHAVVTGARTGTNASLTGDANKITYFTPRFSGFQFGISYTPNTADTNGDSGSAPYDRNSGSIENVVGIGANFSRSFGGIAVGASAGWQSGTTNEMFDPDGGGDMAARGISTDPSQWHVGGTISRGGWTLGGAYANYEGSGDSIVVSTADTSGATTAEFDISDKLAATVWAVGASYNTGPWTVGAGYLQSEQDVGDLASATDNSIVTVTGETTVVNAGASYALAPGVTVAADVSFYEDNDGQNTPNSSKEAVGAGLIMGINF